MASGLVALLDDVAGIAKIAAASLDDVAGAAGKAGTKAVGVVVDDTAVTPGYAMGFTPDRELPIVLNAASSKVKPSPCFMAGVMANPRRRIVVPLISCSVTLTTGPPSPGRRRPRCRGRPASSR